MNGRLLWVDDEIELLRAHILFLANKGYEIITANNGPDALDLCMSHNFDLVLLDENMPGLSGLETLMRLKEIIPTVPIVMVTKNEEENIMDQAIGSKIADYLIKPVNPNQILLTLKKNIHQREIVQEVTQTSYRQDFSRIGIQMSEDLGHEEWKDLYKKLVYWELELAETNNGMSDLLSMQKEEANLNFGKFVRINYETWIQHPDQRPTLSPDVFKRIIFPRLNEGEKIFLVVLDNFRFDQWKVLSQDLADDFDVEEDLYFAILPTSTQYARNAIFSGLMPLQIEEMYPDLWVSESAEEGKNLNEAKLIERLFERFRRKERFSYHKINDSSTVDKILSQFPNFSQTPLNVLVINFVDILSHARTDSRMVRELVGNESAYRSITQSWFRHTPIKDLFRKLASQDFEIIITTDHGSIRVDAPTKVVGDRNINTNLRYKLGKNLSYNAREVFAVREPRKILLPSPNLSTAYIFATGSRFFAYPNNYNYYVQYYKDTFQHGGISMEEMLVPLVTLKPKKRG